MENYWPYDVPWLGINKIWTFHRCLLKLTAGRRFETAVPDVVMMTAAFWDPLAYPIAWNASDLSSKHEIQVTKGWAEAARARGDDLDPGATQKYCNEELLGKCRRVETY